MSICHERPLLLRLAPGRTSFLRESDIKSIQGMWLDAQKTVHDAQFFVHLFGVVSKAST
jgi:hypothetical protein